MDTINTSKEQQKCFVNYLSTEKVICHFFELNQLRIFKGDNLFFFKDKKLFKGMNLVFEIETKPREMTTICVETKQSKLKQLYNYYIKRKF